MNESKQKLKDLLSAKNIADVTFILAILLYISAYVILSIIGKQLGFFELFAILLYGGMTIVVLMVVSFIARAIWLYKNPLARTRPQKVLLVLASIPLWNLFLKSFISL